MKYSVDELAKILDGKLVGNPSGVASRSIFDSRNIVQAEGAVFWAFNGNISGSEFVADAYNKGVRMFVTDVNVSLADDASNIVVEDSIKALQKLSAYHLAQLDLTTIGITGSNGKTIVKEWLFQALFEEDQVIRSPKSYNSQIGLPLSILQAHTNHNLAIFEVGISKPNEMQKLQAIFSPKIGILTNIRESHLENFDSYEALVKEKLLLFKDTSKLVYPYELSDYIAQDNFQKSVSFGKGGEVEITAIRPQSDNRYALDIQLKENHIRVEVPFNDAASLENISCVVASLHLLGYPAEFIQTKLAHLHSLEMRLEIKNGYRDSILIKDEFSLDYPSLEIALGVLKQQMKEKKWVILSDFDQKEVSKNQMKRVLKLLNSMDLEKIICIGQQFIPYQQALLAPTEIFPDARTFLKEIDSTDYKNRVILIKGARKFGLEEISERMEAKSHETVLSVSLHKLIENLNLYRKKLQKDTRIMAMVKANAYGLGLVPISKNLQHFGVDYFGVAYADEGEQLRKSGIYKPIMVMNPEVSGFHKIIENQLEPEIYSFRVLHTFIQELKRKSINTAYPIHIKIDTGMHRLGFSESEIDELGQFLKHNDFLKVESVFSHLSSAGNLDNKEFTLGQLQIFNTSYDALSAYLPNPKPIKHILNTDGVIHYVDYQYDMVRLGIGLYTEKNLTGCQDIASLQSIVSQIKNIKKGESISYNREFIATNDMQIAIVPIGYADGVSRKLYENGYHVSINNKLCPIVGVVCMDMIMVDVSGLALKEGDSVVIFGDKPKLANFATASETITYECLTSISQRIRRVYYKE